MKRRHEERHSSLAARERGRPCFHSTGKSEAEQRRDLEPAGYRDREGSEQLKSIVFDMEGQVRKLSCLLLKNKASERELDESIKHLTAFQDPDIDQVFSVKAPLHRQ